MIPSDSPNFEQLIQRLFQLEELLTHQQAFAQDLSDELVAQSRRLDALQREVARLQIAQLQAPTDEKEERSLEDEKPPHY